MITSSIQIETTDLIAIQKIFEKFILRNTGNKWKISIRCGRKKHSQCRNVVSSFI